MTEDADSEPRPNSGDGGAGPGDSGTVDAAGRSIHDGAVVGKPDPVLSVRGLTKAFGGLLVTDEVDFEVDRGTITGLIGPNGAGKSTFFNLVSGFYEADGGTVAVNGVDVTGRTPHEIADAGLVRTFQTPRKLEGMTVREAMLVGPQHQTGEGVVSLFTDRGTVRAEERANLDRAMDTLERFEIAAFADTPATELSGGQLKLVELARATMTDPDLLLLDEPVAGVNPTLANKLKGFIRELNDDGITFLVIEHDMGFIMDLADPIVVLDQGRVLVEGDPESVRSDDRVVDAYLGGPLDA